MSPTKFRPLLRTSGLAWALACGLSYGSPGLPDGEPSLGGQEWERRVMARLQVRIDEARLGFAGRFYWGPWLWIEGESLAWNSSLSSFVGRVGARWNLDPRVSFSPYAAWDFEAARTVVGAEAFWDLELLEVRPRLELALGDEDANGRFSFLTERVLVATERTQARLGFLYAKHFSQTAAESLVALTTSVAF